MRAVVYETFGGPVAVRDDVPEPPCPPDGALIGVEATGLCRSDWHGWRGHDPDITRFPHVPGHELAGVLLAVGRQVGGDWAPGDRVTVPFVCACGTCAWCRAGCQQVCERQEQPGFTHWGSFAEVVAVRYAAVNLVRLPDGLPSAVAASLGCRFATAYRAVAERGRVRAGDQVAIHGCGGVGLSALLVARALGAEVIAVDVAAAALERAAELGAAATIDATAEPDPAATVRELTGGGAHVSLDCLGAPATLAASIACLRRQGRHVQVGLLPSSLGAPPVPMERVIGHELELLGTHGLAAHAYPRLLALVASGVLDPRRLLARVELTLDELPAALTGMDRADAGPAGISICRP